MSERKLTEEQIDDLYRFCYFSLVPYYDVQVELVDHLASAIEDLWKTKPETPFEEAVHIVQEQFGGELGFYNIRKQKEKAMKRKYRKLLLHIVAEFYKVPKIMITLVLSIGLYLALKSTPNDQWLFIAATALFIGASFFHRFYFFPRHIRIETPEKHYFLFDDVANRGVHLKTGIIFSGALLNLSTHHCNFSQTGSIIMAASISFLIVLFYCDYFFIPGKMREHFQDQFPQFVKA